ncbi:flagellar filament capping protein FliD [Blastococcus sp. TF02A-30]|uniref:flagellar filament capping protein FliD n=1 Tax=Blastococcus sp. TF02A-30 TaxID=2250580 RepID=UPI000DEB9186|nr:flagellar filament capping protein FliD [Blastococcus sp. TF02A-30]RBY89537.1 hypothetical protein DQ241_08810 [Blastococcus sp. TF02A-30]
MAGMAVDGLVSGLDTTNLINQLVAAEGATQSALKTRLKGTETAASAYRTVNTTYLAVTTAAENLLKPETWNATRATSSATSVAAAATTGATPGSLTFAVKNLATTHSQVSTGRWASTTAAANVTTLDVKNADGTSRGTVPLTGTESLAEVASKINSAKLDLAASVVKVKDGEFALQVTSTKSGAAAGFSLSGGSAFADTSTGKDAQLVIGSGAGAYSVYSSTNVFDGLMGGTTITVSKVEADPVTVSVVSDPDSIAAKMQALVDAVNSALTQTKSYTSSAPGSTAALKGDYTLTSLASSVLSTVATGVGKDGSVAKLGLELTKDGKLSFDKAKFLTAVKETPELAKRMVFGTTASNGADGAVGGGDDVAAVTGLAGRLLSLSKGASDSTTGTIVGLANGQDTLGKDLTKRIEEWDLRLQMRRQTLTRQFTAMETALSKLQSQSSWLGGQLASLPSSS